MGNRARLGGKKSRFGGYTLGPGNGYREGHQQASRKHRLSPRHPARPLDSRCRRSCRARRLGRGGSGTAFGAPRTGLPGSRAPSRRRHHGLCGDQGDRTRFGPADAPGRLHGPRPRWDRRTFGTFLRCRTGLGSAHRGGCRRPTFPCRTNYQGAGESGIHDSPVGRHHRSGNRRGGQERHRHRLRNCSGPGGPAAMRTLPSSVWDSPK